MDKSLFRFIWRYSRSRQLVILAITVLSFPILYYTLELPKLIVNDAIQGVDFPRELFDIEFGQVDYLLLLCVGFLFLVVLNNIVKYVLNIYKGVTGERMLRRLRYDLFERVLRFRLPRFRNISSGEIIPMITAEVEPLGGFIGDAIALPAFQGGTLLVYISFIFAQDPFLGMAAISLYPIQAVLIPRLQARVIRLARARVKNIRQMSDRIGESISGIAEIHGNDTSVWHLADMSDRLYTNFQIRYAIFKRKFLIKFVNNFMNQLTPFFFYSVGGYLVIEGDLSFGALVAVLAAYKDLASPWKELLSYYQQFADVQVKYHTVIENFDPPDLYPRERLLQDADEDTELSGELTIKNASYSGGTGQEVRDVSLAISENGVFTFIGDDSSGRSELLQMTASMIAPDTGRVEFGGQDINTLPEAIVGRAIAYVSNAPYIFSDTIRRNLRYGLRRRPSQDGQAPDAESAQHFAEALMTANSPLDINANWDDYAAAGVTDDASLDEQSLELISLFGMGDDVYRMGLQSVIDPRSHDGLAENVLNVRRAISARVRSDPELEGLVDLWSMHRFNPSATLAENLLFALPADPAMTVDRIPHDPVIHRFLLECGLEEKLVEIGLTIAKLMIELFSDVSHDNTALGAFSFITPEDMPEFEAMVRKAKSNAAKLNETERKSLIGIAFKLTPERHRLGILDDALRQRVVSARLLFLSHAPKDFILFDEERYIGPLTIEDNLMFGKSRLDRRDARLRIDGFVGDAVSEMGLRTPISLAGLDFHVGVAGSRLSAGQRRKVALARAMLKQPAITILNGIADSASQEDRELIGVIRKQCAGRTLIIGHSRLELADRDDHIMYLKDGRLVAAGSYKEVADAAAE